MQINKASDDNFLINSFKKADKIVVNRHIKRLRKLHVLGITILPTIGTTWAIFLSFQNQAVNLINLGLLAGMFGLTAVGIEVGYHRYFSHRSFQTTKGISIALGILGSMAAQGPISYWVGLHRCHHEHSDKLNDPHSPNSQGTGFLGKIKGLWHSHLGWMFDHEVPNPIYYCPDILRDCAISKVEQLYFVWLLLGLAIPTVLGGIFTTSWSGAGFGFLWGGVVRLFIGEHLIWTINSVVHVFGSRPFKTKDNSRNLFLLAIPTIGGAWHNNHHAFPNSAITGLQWWQLDLGGRLILLLEDFGLAWNVKVPTQKMIANRLKNSVNTQN